MNLLEVMNENLMNLNLDKKTKNEVIFELCKILEKENRVTNAEKFYKSVLEREKIGETGMGNYLAIPHGESDDCLKASVVVAILKNAVEWESIDDTPAKIVFLIATPKNNKDITHLTMLSQLASILSYEYIQNELIQIKDNKRFMKVFSEYFNKYIENITN